MTILYLKLFAKIVKWVNLTAVIIFVSLWFLDAKPNGRPTKYDMSEKKKKSDRACGYDDNFHSSFSIFVPE